MTPSMGPRAFTLGNVLCLRPSRFLSRESFNGAEGFHPRKRGISRIHFPEAVSLQWGRGLSPSETEMAGRLCYMSYPPSMGPRAFTLGNSFQSEMYGTPFAWTFNGAEGFHPRKHAYGRAEGGIRCLLQWGRGLSPSETSAWETYRQRHEHLQWGRGLSPSETRCAIRSRAAFRTFNGAEGFHPRKLAALADGGESIVGAFNGAEGFHPRKLGAPQIGGTKWQRPSMGPRAFTLGNQPSSRPIGSPANSFNGAEGFHPRKHRGCLLHLFYFVTLQWGRGLSPSETRPSG